MATLSKHETGETGVFQIPASEAIVKVLDPTSFPLLPVTKTRGIWATPTNQALKMNLCTPDGRFQTREGLETPRRGSWLCFGTVNEPWLQDRTNLFSKYNIGPKRSDGFHWFTPKDANRAWAAQILHPTMWAIRGLWGEEQPDGSFLQRGQPGDYLLRHWTEANDWWIVDQVIFNNTYEFVSYIARARHKFRRIIHILRE